MRKPFASWPHFATDEVEAATRVLQSGKVNYWTGEEGREFEKEFAEFGECKHAWLLKNSYFVKEAEILRIENVYQNGDRRL